MNKFGVTIVLIIVLIVYAESRGGRSGSSRRSSSRNGWGYGRRSYSMATRTSSYRHPYRSSGSASYRVSSYRISTSKPSYSYGTSSYRRSSIPYLRVSTSKPSVNRNFQSYTSNSWESSSRLSQTVSTSKPSYTSSSSYHNSYGRPSATVVTTKPTPNSSFGDSLNWESLSKSLARISTSNPSYRQNTFSRNILTTPKSTVNPYFNAQSYNHRKNSEYYPNTNYNNNHGRYGGIRLGIKEAVLAGLGGSALGLYLGHQLGSMNRNSQPNLSESYGSGSFQPQYSVVHHYHQGERPIVKNAEINYDIVRECNNITFCVPNTKSLCLTNGTVYCLTPMSAVTRCSNKFGEQFCVDTTLTVPCLSAKETNCNVTSQNITVEIPCVANLYVKFATENINSAINSSNSSIMDTCLTQYKVITSRTAATNSTIVNVKPDPITPASTSVISLITNHDVSNEFCVIIIANPAKSNDVPNAKD